MFTLRLRVSTDKFWGDIVHATAISIYGTAVLIINIGFPGSTSGKEPSFQCRRHKRHRLIPGLGRSPGGGHGNPLQYSCLENPTDSGAWWAAAHRVTELDMTEMT